MENVYEAVPDGIWTATYAGYEVFDFVDKKTGKPARCYRHLWDVEVNEQSVRVGSLSDLNPTPHNRYGKIFKAMEGRDIKPMERAPIEKWTGRKATLVFETREGKSVVMNVLPAKV